MEPAVRFLLQRGGGRPSLVVVVAFVVGLVPLLGGGARALAQVDPAPAEVALPEPPAGSFIELSPAVDKVAVNMPVWLAVDPAVWRPLSATTDVVPTTTTTAAPTVVPAPPVPPTAAPPPPAPTRFTVTVRPLYVDWELGDGQRRRCFGPGRVYDPSLPLSVQSSECTHTYRQPREEVTVKAAITYGTVVVVEAPGEPPREEVLEARVARDEVKVRVNELQALDPGVPLAEMFPPGGEGGPPVSAQVVLPSEDEPGEAREGEYFPDPPSGWDRFTSFVKDVGPTVLKVGAVVATAVAVAAVCSTGIGCVILAGVAAGAMAGGLFCNGDALGCIAKGALAGGVAAGAFLAAPFVLGALGLAGAGAVTTAVVGGALAGFAGTLTSQLLDGNVEPTSLVVNTIGGALTAGLFSKVFPGAMGGLRARGSPPVGTGAAGGRAAPSGAPTGSQPKAPPAAAPAPPQSRVVPGGGLAAHEAAGGHTLARHVGLSADDLAARLAAQPNIKAASTFSNREVAESSIAATLDDNKLAIEAWLRNGGGNAGSAFTKAFPEPVGMTLTRGSPVPAVSGRVRVVLRPDPSMRGGYRILTAFPE